MEDTGEDADARLPRVVLPHRHRGYKREGTRETGDMDIKRAQHRTEHDRKKNKRAYIGEDATGEEAGSDGVRC